MILPYSHITFKEGFEKVLRKEWESLRPKAQEIANDMARYCELHNMPFVITDILSDIIEDLKLGRVSASHREGRAFDFRINWPKIFKEKFESVFENVYKDVAAIAKSSGLPNLILYHDVDHGLHGHCQIKP